MVDEIQVPPFLQWLIGPSWYEGAFYQLAVVVPLLVILLVLAGLLIWSLRKESRLAAGIAACLPVAIASIVFPNWLIAWKTPAYAMFLTDNADWLLGPNWWEGVIYSWLTVVFSLMLAGMLIGLLLSVLNHGPLQGPRLAWRTMCDGAVQLASLSPRRVSALASLAVKESIRRRVVVGFAVFIVILLFAGWFLDPGSTNPARLYLSFVLTATSYLVLLLSLFLSAFSLPTDLRTKTLHTIVTKPVRPSEIVLGRMAGFAIVGTGLLALMCAVSYVFVVRGLDHTHTLAESDLGAFGQAAGDQARAQSGRTSPDHGHRHDAIISSSGDGRVDPELGHWHSVSHDEKGYEVGPSEGNLLARVPVYGKIDFRARDGVDGQGVNVGDEWTYRSFIAGGSQAAAIWKFSNLSPAMFPERLPVEMTIGVFRTHKGDIEKGVLGSISVRNPKNGLTVEVEIFESKEFTTKQLSIPRKISKFSSAQVISRKVPIPGGGVEITPSAASIDPTLADKTEFDLFDDIAVDGELEIWLRCVEPRQYFGAAQNDLYLRAADAPFWLNFVKGYFGIWLQMVLVIGFGVMFSTFLSGAVAMIATVGVLIGGFVSSFMRELALGETFGGGPVESLIRLVRQQNIMSELDPGLGGEVAQMVDSVLAGYGLRAMTEMMPAFGDFSFATYVAYGFDVSADLIMVRTVGMLGFLVPVFVAGYFFLKTREVAR